MDPDAVKFRDVEKIDGTNCVVGEVNGKNGFGAYTGFQPFIVQLDSHRIALAPKMQSAGGKPDVIAEARWNVFSLDCRLPAGE